MSGPKLSQAQLDRMKAQRLQEEREREARRLAKGRIDYQACCAALRQLAAGAQEGLDALSDPYRKEAEDELRQTIASLTPVSVADESNVAAFEAAVGKMRTVESSARSMISGALAKYQKMCDADRKVRGDAATLSALSDALTVRGGIIKSIQASFASDYNEARLKEKIREVLAYLKTYCMTSQYAELAAYAEKKGKELEQFLSQTDLFSHKKSLEAYLQEIFDEEAEIRRQAKEKEELYARYLAIASMIHVKPKEPDAFAGKKELEEAIDDIEETWKCKDEMDHIADEIDEVMRELGYTFVASRVLTRKDGTEFDDSLYAADSQTGISVYTDESGAVMMRMTVLGDDPQITDADRDFSYQRQIDFCAGHPDIVAALEKRGVHLEQKDYKEPDPAYTYKQVTRQKSAGSTKGKANKKQKKNRSGRHRGNKNESMQAV